MKKSNYIALVMGTVSMMMFAIGMCMALQPAWNVFGPGCAFGAAGLLSGTATVGVWRKMENKAPVRLSARLLFRILLCLIGMLTLGIGMCFSMVWGSLVIGGIIGIAGILILLCLIPACVGIR